MSEEANTGSNPVASEPVQTEQTAAVAAPVATTPDKPSEPLSARQSIEKAFATVSALADDAPVKSDKLRSSNGQFAAKEAKPTDATKIDGAELAAAPVTTPLTAPSRFTKQAQADWALAPESVRTEAVRLEKELTQGIEKYREAAEAFEPIRQYHDLAKQHGTSMADALQNYVRFDNMWAGTPGDAFFETCRATRHDPRAVAQEIFNRLQGQPTQVDQRDTLIRQQQQEIAQLKEEFGGIKQTFKQSQEQQVYNNTLSEVQKFASEHPYFEELLPSITQMIETKFATDLSDGYEKAKRLNPEVAAKIESDKAAKAPKQPASNAKAALSIAGSPNGGSNPTTKPAGSPREALNRAFASLAI